MKLRRIIHGNARLLMAAVIALAASSSPAGLIVVADFNDIATGGISGKAGGTGFTGNWSGSAIGQVVAGNLTSSLYGVTQSGTAQHYRNTNGTGLRQNYRSVAPATIEGDVWFSFLAKTEGATHRAGLSLNVTTTASPFANTGDVYAYLVGDTLNYSFGAGTAGTAAAAAVGATNLIVGKLSVNDGGADSISLWLNPDLVANPDINSLTPVYNSSSFNFIEALTRIGAVGSGEGGTTGGRVDNILFSDGNGNANQAYFDVTGATAIPEPSSALLVSLGAAGYWRWRRRRRTTA